MLVENLVLVENKAVQRLLPIHEAQILTYLKASNHRLGFLVQWNVTKIKDGIRRIVHRL
jgi:GxxExxY protein